MKKLKITIITIGLFASFFLTDYIFGIPIKAANQHQNTATARKSLTKKNKECKEYLAILHTASGTSHFIVEVVYKRNDIRRGLMYRKKMAQTHGMLFVLGRERPLTFWMKNTFIPLDIIFFNQHYRIIRIHKNALPCKSETTKCPLFTSEKPAKYVLELNAGISDKVKLKEGDKLSIDQI